MTTKLGNKQNKEKTSVSISAPLKERSDALVANDKYANFSNFVETTIAYYLGARDKELELELKKCKEEIERLRDENEKKSALIIKLLSDHQELIAEANSFESKQRL